MMGAILLGGAMNIIPGRIPLCAVEKEESRQEFSTLPNEIEFWREWLRQHPSKADGGLDLYYPLGHKMDLKLAAIAQRATSFVLIMTSGSNTGFLQIIALAKTNDYWEQTQWERKIRDGVSTMKKSVVQSPKIDEDILKILSESPVTFMPCNSVNDAASTIMFVRHSGKSNRFAIHFLGQLQLYEKDVPQTPVISAMKSLLQSVGVLSPDGK